MEKKNLNFNIDDYPKFKDKINYIIIENEPTNLKSIDGSLVNNKIKRMNSIKRIEQSYDYMMKGLGEIQDNDLVMISDNDEIPKLDSINLNEIGNNFLIFEQFFFIISLIFFMIK